MTEAGGLAPFRILFFQVGKFLSSKDLGLLKRNPDCKLNAGVLFPSHRAFG